MKSNARCWTPPAAAPLIVMLWLSACAMGDFDGPAACPPVVKYTKVDQLRAAIEVEALPEDAVVLRMLSDYAVLRDQSETCR